MKDLAFDASTFKVRLAVIKGLKTMIHSCPRSHVTMNKVLPKISDCLHDVNDSVRIAMLDLLLEVKKVRVITYFEVCPMEHLLARLEVDKSSQVCSKIASLIFNSFFPEKDNEAQFERALKLIEMNRNASRKFFELIYKKISVHDQVLFMLTILVKIKRNIKVKETNSESTDEDDNENKENGRGDKSNKTAKKKKRKALGDRNDANSDDEDQDNEVESDERLNKLDIVTSLLDIVAILWVLRSKELGSAPNNQYRSLLEKKAGKILTVLFKHYRQSASEMPIVYLCSMLPSNAVATVSGFCLSKLKNTNENNTIFADALCNWGRGDDLCDLIISGIKNDPLIKKNSVEKTKKKTKGVRFEESFDCNDQNALEMKSESGLTLIKYLIGHPVNRAMMLRKNRDNLEELRSVLINFIPVADQNERTLEAFEILLKLTVLLHDKENFEQTFHQIEDIVTVVKDDFVANKKSEQVKVIAAKTLLICCNMISIGICDVNFIGHCCDLAEVLLEEFPDSFHFLSILLCQETASWITKAKANDCKVLFETGIPDILSKAINNETFDVKVVKTKLAALINFYHDRFYKIEPESFFKIIKIFINKMLESEEIMENILPLLIAKNSLALLLLEELEVLVKSRKDFPVLKLMEKLTDKSKNERLKSCVRKIVTDHVQTMEISEEEFQGERETKENFNDLLRRLK